MCHNVLNGISEPPTGRCFERVRSEEKCGITQDTAVMHLHLKVLMTVLFHVIYVFLVVVGNGWRSELGPDQIPD